MLREVTSVFMGITTPESQLYDEIHKRGWQVSSVRTKDGQYEATARNPHGDSVSKVGMNPQTALGALLLHIVRREYMRQGSWNKHWVDRLEPIAQAYAEAPHFDPSAASAWKELADDSVARADHLGQQLHIEYVDEPEPYKDAQALIDDVTKKQHLFVSRAALEHPVWTPEQVLAFRVVHDVLGHAAAGGDFGWTGENLATAAHMPYLSPSAQQALFTETIGNKAYNHYYRGYGPPKVTFLNDYFEDVADSENPAGHGGLAPSMTLAPGKLPERKAGVKRDPNYGFQTGITPMYDVPGQFGDPLNYNNLKDFAHSLNTGWANWNVGGQPDYERMRQAIVNAFRVALLSPQKALKWNAAHYQDLSNIPYTVTDPKVMWDALDQRRIEYNRSQGVMEPEIAHKPWYRNGTVLEFYRYYAAHHPEMNLDEVKENADREIMYLRADIEHSLMEDAKEPDMEVFEPKVDSKLDKALKQFMKDGKTIEALGAAPALPAFPPELPTAQPGEKYGGFMASPLVAIARVSLYADDLLEAALEDVRNNDGAGHIFRERALTLGIPYVGPKVASFAWMMLQPLTSQLATIDTHMADVLGYNQPRGRGIPKRDYFGLERQLQAGRDALGYNHLPLGLFQWGMWDVRRHGEDQDHQDHSALRVWNPTPWQSIHWQPVVKGLTRNKGDKWTPPDWWALSEPFRDQEKAAWNVDVASHFGPDQIPWSDKQLPVTFSKVRVPRTRLASEPDERARDRERMHPVDFERKYDWDRADDLSRPHVQQFVEWVPTSALEPFMEYKRGPGQEHGSDPVRWKALTEHILGNGFKTPLWIDYNHQTGTAHLSEGNHRLGIALAHNVPAVPVRVIRSMRTSPTGAAVPVQPDPSILDPRDGWVPEYMKPSHIGLPTIEPWTPPHIAAVWDEEWEPHFDKTADYQGWTNWHTWNTKLMMDNDYDLYQMQEKMAEDGWTPEQIRDWAIKHVIGPHNKQAIEDAQEWNSIPEEERLDHNYEDLKERNPDAADLVNNLGFGPDVSDSEPDLLDPELVNWNEIHQHIMKDHAENAKWEQEEAANKEKYNYHVTGHDDYRNAMYDAWLTHHVGEPSPDPEAPYRDKSYGRIPAEWPLTEEDAHEGYTPERWDELRPSYKDKAWQAIRGIERGTAAPYQYSTMQQALQARGYTPEQIEDITRTRFTPQGERLQPRLVPPPDPTQDEPGDLTIPEHWSKLTEALTQAVAAQTPEKPARRKLIVRRDEHGRIASIEEDTD